MSLVGLIIVVALIWVAISKISRTRSKPTPVAEAFKPVPIKHLRVRAWVLYGIQILCILLVWYSDLALAIFIIVPALIVSLRYRSQAQQTWLKSHFTWAVTFFISIVVFGVFFSFLMMFAMEFKSLRYVHIVAWGLIGAWAAYRILRGMVLVYLWRPTSSPLFIGPKEVAPFGFTIGKATLKEVQQNLSSKGQEITGNTNPWTQGQELKVFGNGLGIEGLEETKFIFDSKEMLVSVSLEVMKARYEELVAQLQEKYKKVAQSRDPFESTWGEKLVWFLWNRKVNRKAEKNSEKFVEFRAGRIVILVKSIFVEPRFHIEYSLENYLAAIDEGTQQKRQQQWVDEAARL